MDDLGVKNPYFWFNTHLQLLVIFFLEAPLGDGISRIQKQQLQSPGVTWTQCEVVSVRP